MTHFTIGRCHFPNIRIGNCGHHCCPCNSTLARIVNCISGVGSGSIRHLGGSNGLTGCTTARSVNGLNVRHCCRSILRNRANCRRIRIGGHKHIVHRLGRMPPRTKRSVCLALSLGLRRCVRALLTNDHTTIIIASPHANKILTLISAPDCSPGLFISNVSDGSCSTLLGSPGAPLIGHTARKICPPTSAIGPCITISTLDTKIVAHGAALFSPN